MKNCVVGKCPKKSKVVGKCPKLEVGKCPRKNRKLENVLSYFFDSLRILDISPRIRSLGARDNRKVRLVTHSRHLP